MVCNFSEPKNEIISQEAGSQVPIAHGHSVVAKPARDMSNKLVTPCGQCTKSKRPRGRTATIGPILPVRAFGFRRSPWSGHVLPGTMDSNKTVWVPLASVQNNRTSKPGVLFPHTMKKEKSSFVNAFQPFVCAKSFQHMCRIEIFGCVDRWNRDERVRTIMQGTPNTIRRHEKVGVQQLQRSVDLHHTNSAEKASKQVATGTHWPRWTQQHRGHRSPVRPCFPQEADVYRSNEASRFTQQGEILCTDTMEKL